MDMKWLMIGGARCSMLTGPPANVSAPGPDSDRWQTFPSQFGVLRQHHLSRETNNSDHVVQNAKSQSKKIKNQGDDFLFLKKKEEGSKL